MPIDKTVFEIDYESMFESMFPLELECIGEQDGILRCKLTWTEAKARPGFLFRLEKHAEKQGKIIWFQKGDPYKGSKPFDILWIGIERLPECGESTTIILVVRGKKTPRIEKKWPAKFSALFGYKVSIIWEEEDTQ